MISISDGMSDNRKTHLSVAQEKIGGGCEDEKDICNNIDISRLIGNL